MLKSVTLVAVLLPCMLPSMAVPAYADHRPAYADHRYVDTETLYGWCKPRALGKSIVGRLCAGYISAIADVFDHKLSLHGRRACIPEQERFGDLRAIVVKTLENRPKDADKNDHACAWVAQAFAKNYPCKR